MLILLLLSLLEARALQLTVIEQTLHTRHRPPPGQTHAEVPERLFAASDALRAAFGDSDSETGDGNLLWRRAVDSDTTSPEDAVAVLKTVHDVDHLRDIVALSKVGGGYDSDTYCAPGSWEAMLDGTRCWIDAIKLALDSDGPVFALSRPAGHHATRKVAMGFGLVNFAAAAASAALKRANCNVAILDWDVHHGNGVAAIFREEPRVKYCSLHEAGGFPGSGMDEADQGPCGNTLNLPLEKGSGSALYLETLRNKALPFLLGSEPTVLLICAGYDALDADPLATLKLGPDDYRASVQMIIEDFGFPRERIALGLEGGYSLDEETGMPAGVVATCSALLDP